MKKTFSLLSCLVIISTTVKAQHLSYGVILGGDFYNVINNSGVSNFKPSGDIFSSSFGAYGEYNFNEKIGIKTEVTFTKNEIQYYPVKSNFSLSLLQISPSLKYDFGQEYRKGFYMLLGTKLSLMTKATLGGADAKDAFETATYGIQYGIGTRVYKYFDIETKLDYEITPFFELDSYKSNFFNVYINLGIDLERLFNK